MREEEVALLRTYSKGREADKTDVRSIQMSTKWEKKENCIGERTFEGLRGRENKSSCQRWRVRNERRSESLCLKHIQRGARQLKQSSQHRERHNCIAGIHALRSSSNMCHDPRRVNFNTSLALSVVKTCAHWRCGHLLYSSSATRTHLTLSPSVFSAELCPNRILFYVHLLIHPAIAFSVQR